jgi:pimeloyl-ACP methyl ester carboxylesterase
MSNKLLLLILASIIAISKSKNFPSKNFLDYKTIINNYGYSFEEYEITTNDGYILNLWRIPGKLNSKSNKHNNKFFGLKKEKKVILLQHGLLDDSWTWFALKNNSLPFLLSNQNYDVFISNIRGNLFSYKHKNSSYDSSDLNNKKYWNFSFSEMAEIDLPCIIENIKKISKTNKIDYIGHSQGSLIFFLQYMTNPNYLENNINKFIAVGTVPNVNNALSIFVKIFANTGLLNYFPFENVFKYEKLGEILYYLCKNKENLCWDLIKFAFDFRNTKRIKGKNLVENILIFEPGGTSKKNLLHWMQVYLSKQMMKYDYGKLENIKIYGQEKPPIYNLDNLYNWNIKSLLFTSDSDPFSNPIDIKETVDKIKNKHLIQIPFMENYNHVDFLWSNDAILDIYPKIIQFLDE